MFKLNLILSPQSQVKLLNIKVKSMRNEANRLEELFIEMVNSNEK